MGTTTTKGIFSDATTEMANMLKALGHPARFEIINLLKTEKTCCGSTIMNLIPLSQSTIFKHLTELKNADIITCENKGSSANYTLNENALQKIEFYFKNNTFKQSVVLPEIKKVTVLNSTTETIYTNKKSIKSNSKLKKENYVFKHLLLKSVTLKN